MSASATGVLGAANMWVGVPMYNTVMGVAAGAGLVLVVLLGRKLIRKESVVPDAWALAFGVLGTILTLTGLHMTLTWPVASLSPSANIYFGEPVLFFGVLLLAAAFFMWRRFGGAVTDDGGVSTKYLVDILKPISLIVGIFGLPMIGLAIAGVDYALFAAPPMEPISGELADHPLVESMFISALYLLVGVGQLLLPLGVHKFDLRILRVVGIVWFIAGVIWIAFSSMNYYTHVGLIQNTI
jgi:uncharacterized membrane protein